MTKHLCDACKGEIDNKPKAVVVEDQAAFEVCGDCAEKLTEILTVKHSFKRGRPVKSKADRKAWQAA